MNINTSNRDIRDVGICAGVVVLVNIVWGLSSDLINQRRAKKAKPTDTRTTAEMLADIEASVKDLHVQMEATNSTMDTLGESLDVCQDELDKLSAVVFTPEQVKEVTKIAETLLDHLDASVPSTATVVQDALSSQEKTDQHMEFAREWANKMIADADAADVVEVVSQELPAEEITSVETPAEEVPGLKAMADEAGYAYESLTSLLEDPEATNKELTDAQDLCKSALKSYREMLDLLSDSMDAKALEAHQYRYADLLSCYGTKLPALKKARAANGRKAKQAK